ncbi:TIGR00266 family protein [Halosegnis marinus]|uniref:TIGR00266 family protein n=1 Tax=Halosegnis marinus TaxID=3034023 RepID=A0ABD5ZMD1_9EURY|nr:TIGR00266 family protein [Halosegnis sp. DT85]
MDYDIAHRPSEATVTVELGPGERAVAEAGALVAHTDGIDIETGARGGVFGSLKRMLGGESFFVNTFSAGDSTGEVTFAGPLPGDVVHVGVGGTEGDLFATAGSFLAASGGVEVDTEFGGARTFLGGEGLFLLRLSGDGPAWLTSYGAIDRRDLADGETYVVDTGHVVAFRDAEWDTRRVGGLKSTLFSGEGLVCTFTGPGTVWTQTRSPDAFVAWLAGRLPSGTSSSSADTSRGGSDFSVRF